MTPKQRAEEAAREIRGTLSMVVNITPGVIEPIIERALLAQAAEHEAEQAKSGDRAETTTENPRSVAAWRERALKAEAERDAAVAQANRYLHRSLGTPDTTA